MSGKIVRASKAADEHGIKKKKNGKYSMKDSSGNPRDVSPGTMVYHRGKKNFAEYSESRDMAITAQHKSRNGSTKKRKVGTGRHRQESDVVLRV